MKSKIFLNNSLRTKMKGQLWIPIFLAIGFFLAFPVAELLILGNWTEIGYTVKELAQNYEHLWKEFFLYTGAVVTFSAAFINGVNGFWYLYSPAKTDFYHCLPVKRSRMFFEKTILGSLYFLVPYAAMEFLAVCIGAMNGYFSLVLMKMAVKMLTAHFLMYLLGYFCVVLAISLTGNLLMGGLMTAGISLYGPILGILIKTGKANFFYTYDRSEMFRSNPGNYFSPFTLSNLWADAYGAGTDSLWLLLCILLFAGFAAAAAYLAYTRRPMEAAGKSMVYRWVGVLVEFLIVIPGGIGIGLVFCLAAGNAFNNLWWILGLVFGTILIHGMMQVIYALDFRRFFSAKPLLFLMGICVAVNASILQFDLLGYDSYIPEYENLAEIEIDGSEFLSRENQNRVVTEKEGRYQFDERTYRFLNNRTFYDYVREILGKQKDRIENNHLEDTDAWLRVNYIRKAGREASRQYWVTEEEVKEIWKYCCEDSAFKQTQYSFLQIDTEYLDSVQGVFSDGISYVLFQEEKEKYEKLVEALKADIEEADAVTFAGIPVASLDFEYLDLLPMTGGGKETAWFSAYVYPEYERTLAILEETEYPLYLNDWDIEYAECDIYGGEKNVDYSAMNRIKITDKESLEELKAALIPYCFDTAWIDTEERIYVEIKLANGDNIYSSMLLKEKVPEFLKEEIEKVNGGEEKTQL